MKFSLSCFLVLVVTLILPVPSSHAGETGVMLTETIQLKIADAFMEEGE